MLCPRFEPTQRQDDISRVLNGYPEPKLAAQTTRHLCRPIAQNKQESCHIGGSRLAGPVGFEPTILGYLRPQASSSEGPRLGPGSTTGPAAISNLLAPLLPWANRLERGPGQVQKFPGLIVRNFRAGDDSVFFEILSDSSGPPEFGKRDCTRRR